MCVDNERKSKTQQFSWGRETLPIRGNKNPPPRITVGIKFESSELSWLSRWPLNRPSGMLTCPPEQSPPPHTHLVLHLHLSNLHLHQLWFWFSVKVLVFFPTCLSTYPPSGSFSSSLIPIETYLLLSVVVLMLYIYFSTLQFTHSF